MREVQSYYGVNMSCNNENTTELLCYPIAFKILDPDDHTLVPIKVDWGMYYLRCPKQIWIANNSIPSVKRGLAIKIPDILSVSTSMPGVSVPLIPHINIDTIYDTFEDTGIEIIAPKVLSASYNDLELQILIRNSAGKTSHIDKGAPIACVHFSVTPPILLGENINI